MKLPFTSSLKSKLFMTLFIASCVAFAVVVLARNGGSYLGKAVTEYGISMDEYRKTMVRRAPSYVTDGFVVTDTSTGVVMRLQSQPKELVSYDSFMVICPGDDGVKTEVIAHAPKGVYTTNDTVVLTWVRMITGSGVPSRFWLIQNKVQHVASAQ